MNDTPVTVLASTDQIEVLYQPAAGRDLLITFNGLARRADGRSFSAQEVARKLDMPAIGFMSREGNWFPVESMTYLTERIAPILGQYDRRLLYGFSMGGYGAIKFSRMLGATHVLSMSPQWSIHPEVAPWELRYLKYQQFCKREMQIESGDCGGSIYLIYDKDDQDHHHADRIAERAPIRRIHAPFAGHDTWKLFLSSRVMGGLFDAVLGDDVPSVTRIVRERTRMLPDRRSRLLLARARQLLRAGRLVDAERAAGAAGRSDIRLPGGACVHASILFHMNRGHEAETILREEMERFPELTWLAVHLSRVLEAQGRFQEALDALQPMFERTPLRADLRTARDRLLQRTTAA